MMEHEKVKAWRERHKLSLAALADLSGYSESALSWFERGLTPTRPGKKPKNREITWFVWHRYKMVMAAVEQELNTGRKFEW